jgi:integrase
LKKNITSFPVKKELEKVVQKKRHKGIYQRNGIYWIAYSDGHGGLIRESTKEMKSIEKVRKILEEKHTEVLQGKHPIVEKGRKMKFSDFAKEYLLECEAKKSFLFIKQIVNKLENHFGRYYLDQITMPVVKKYRMDRRRDTAKNRKDEKGMPRLVSPSTVNREIAILRNLLNVAVENGRLKYNPLLFQKKLYEKEHIKQYIFSDAEIKALIAEASLPLRWFILMAVNTGCREGEIMGLRWDEVDLRNKVITLTSVRTKSSRTRTIGMTPAVITLLSELHLKNPKGEYVFPNPETSKPYKWISHAWKQLKDKCKVPKVARFHDLRHTFATYQAMSGTPQTVIRDILGHRYSTTTDRYMGSTNEEMKRAFTRVNYGVPAGEIVQMDEKKIVGK